MLKLDSFFSIENSLVKGRNYIVAVSGGPDSVFLLDKMRQSGYDFIVAHVNYKKRKDSDFDEEIIRNYCQNYSLNFEVKLVKENEYFLRINFQAQARQIRYEFFQELAKKYQTIYIIVAHHKNDHLETYLLQKKRRSLVDYWGLSKKTRLGKYWIFRPLLSLSKNFIYRYLSEKKIVYATDFTNQLPIYQRNIIRQELNNLNEEEKNNLGKEINKKNQELKRIKKMVKNAIKNLVIYPNIFQLNKNFEYPLEVCLRSLYFWINQVTNGLIRQKKKCLLKEVYKQLFVSKKTNLIIKLGGGFCIVKGNNQAVISPIKIYYNERKGIIKER